MILPAQTIRALKIVSPLVEQSKVFGATYGVGPSGYDIRLFESVLLWPGRFTLASSYELFNMPDDLLGVVHDKSTWARLGVAVQNTVIEPGWRGYLTLEITMHRLRFMKLKAGTPIAQVVFHRLESATELPYTGKYQDQKHGAQQAIRN